MRSVFFGGAAIACAVLSVCRASAAPVDYGHVGDFNVCDDRRVNLDERIRKCKDYLTQGGLGAHDNGAALNNLGLAYLEKGDKQNAPDSYNMAIKLYPQAWFAYANRANLYAVDGKLDLALSDYNSAATLGPDDYRVLTMRGHFYGLKGDYARAMADYDVALKLAPDKGFLWNDACWERALANTDLVTAETQCKRAVALQQGKADPMDSLGFVQFRQGRLADAHATYDAVLALNDKEASSLYMRGIIKRRTGDAAGGDADIEAAEALDPKVATTFAGYGVSRVPHP
ncbi:MAG TPA: tetratricopeptide repeat protein [Rhizomicrobium sp.]|jgi:tetratricopeptide (TPR) repeat protein